MIKRPVSNQAASVRQRLMNLRQARGEDYNAILTQYAVERFLYRLCRSPHVDRFILKGAMLFRVWAGNLHRPTKDLDLLGHGEATPQAVAMTVRQVLATKVDDDGLTFDADGVVATEILEEQEYGGIRVKLVAILGSARIPMQIDVGFGDAVTPTATKAAFPTLLEMSAPILRMYPPHTVVAEKLEAAVVRGLTNSRMRDYYDLLVIFRIHKLDDDELVKAIRATFQRRKTEIPREVPAGLSEEFAIDASAGRLWREFLRRVEIKDAPEGFAEVVQAVRDRVWPIMVQARNLKTA
ncbi:MAG: nucleotidyl transferase AbiEii/AbiGii toxin family protein [Verrucomicrobia bacterium]|nr:nucleotidyl transferase AbiEii/AbiGii toxin family protein [Verrucomicrobiota bacterium]